MASSLYSTNLTTSTLAVSDSRIICGLLLDDANQSQWRQAILLDNVLQKRNPVAAQKTAAHLRQRFTQSQPPLWCMVRDGSSSLATQATLAATVKHSRLVGDFLDSVVRERRRQFKTTLDNHDWSAFIEECALRDPNVLNWSESVRDKLRQNVFHILAEGGFLANTKSRHLQTVMVERQLLNYLEEYRESYVLHCLQVDA